MTYCATRGVGQYVASEVHNATWERASKATSRGAIYGQGSHGVADALITDPWSISVAQGLADRGYRSIAGDLSQTTSQGTYGNDTARTRIGQLRTYLQGTIGAASGKVWGWGGSGGCTALINYARQNPGNVAALALVVPLVDVQDFHDNTTNGGANGQTGSSGVTPAEIETAYGGLAAYNAAMPTHNPVLNAADLVAVPVRCFYSTTDPLINISKVTAFVAGIVAAGGVADMVSIGPVGHTGGSLSGATVADFFDQYA